MNCNDAERQTKLMSKCMITCDWKAELKSASPPLRAPHSKVVLRYFAAMSEANRLGYRALLRFSVAVRVTAAATRLPPEAKIRVAYF